MPHIKPNPPRPPPPTFPPIRPDPDQNDNRALNHLARAISAATEALAEFKQEQKAQFEWFKSNLNSATKNDLKQMEERLMSKFSDYVAEQKAYNTEHSSALDSITESQADLNGDIDELNRKITELQNRPDGWTPEDQALLDGIRADGTALAAKSTSVAAALKATAERTPPVVVPPPPA